MESIELLVKDSDTETAIKAEKSDRSEQAKFITQSKYFTPAFNAAIFDGPIRIYFAQFQEAQALKIYFILQERFADLRTQTRGIFKDRSRNIFVMMYPSRESFENSFVETNSNRVIVTEYLGTDSVIGVCGPVEDSIFSELCGEVEQAVRAVHV